MDQLGTIVDRQDLHTLGQARLDLRDLRLHTFDHIERVFALAHDDDTGDHVPRTVKIRHAAPQVRPQAYLPDVLHSDRGAVIADLQNNVLEIPDGTRVTQAADHVLRAAEIYEPATDVVVALPDGLDHLADGQPVSLQTVGIHVDLILLVEAADRRHFRDAGDRPQVIAQVPVLARAQFRQAVLIGLVGEHVLKHPAEPRGVRPELGLDLLREARQDRGKVLERARAGPIDVGPVIEDDVNVRIPEIRKTADRLDVRGAEHRGHYRIRHLVFNDVGTAIPAGEDDNLGVAQVRNGVQGDIMERPPTGNRETKKTSNDKEAVPGGKLDDAIDHCAAPWSDLTLSRKRWGSRSKDSLQNWLQK